MLLLLAYLLLAAALQTQSVSVPFIGVWKENPEKSDYGSTPPPKSVVWTIEDRGEGMFVQTAVGTAANGQSGVATQTLKCDGKDYPGTLANAPAAKGFTSCLMRDARTFAFTVKDELGRVLNLYTRTMSPDGKTFTQAIKWLTSSGQVVSELTINGRRVVGPVSIFEKQ
jgi:hypothetical protein